MLGVWPFHAGLAQNLCFVPESTPLVEAAADEADLGDDIEVTFGQLDASAFGGAEFTGNVDVRLRDQRFSTDSARYDRGANFFEFEGRVEYRDSDVAVFSENARFDSESREASFGNSGFELPARSAHGSASSIEIDRVDQTVSLRDTLFTTCPMEAMAWQLTANDVELDLDDGIGSAHGMKLKFGKVPLIYAPYFTFPLNDERKSGFLTPSFANGDRTGFYIAAPYYFNLAPNYDLLVEPRYLSARGLQIANEFRYLMQRSEGQFVYETLPSDDKTGLDRNYLNLQHETFFGEDGDWRVVAAIEEVSDTAYFEDLGTTLSDTSQTHLNRYVDVGYVAPNWSFVTRFQNYQTIDPLIEDADRPYERIPQMLFEGSWLGRLLQFTSDTELVNFNRSVGTTGWRFDTTQEMSLRFERAGMYLSPALAWRQTNYWLDDVAAGANDTPSRGLPIASVDSGLVFERLAGAGKTIQTLEPRMLYVSIPYEDQSDLPIFDTIMPDFNLVQLFRKYQFVGPDRVSDTDQLSIGVTTRLIDAASGRERLSATVGQTRYMSPQRVSLPDKAPIDSSASDYVARVSVAVNPAWNLDVGYQWNSETSLTARTETRFEYRPQDDRIFGIGYRYRRDLLEQGDISLVWPVSERWRIIGRYSYSLLEKTALEQFVGWEYDACCWRLRVIGRQYVSRRTGETDNAISFQLELKGLSNSGNAPEELLDRGILGYRRIRDDTQL
jgi:LPS-assembly protein